MDDEPMWAVDRVVAPTPSSSITIPEIANEFAIKDTKNEVVRLMMFPLTFTGEAKTWPSNSDTEKIMARMDAMTMKMDAQYKEMKSRSNPISEYDERWNIYDLLEVKQNSCKPSNVLIFTMITVTQIMITGIQAEETIIVETTTNQTLLINLMMSKDN
ncbi:hypothetical protein Tco_0867635 [Tanacetum coccineum]